MNERYYPESLKRCPVWALWRMEQDAKGRLTKVPYSPHYNGRAASNNPKTWGTFDQAQNKLRSRPDYYNGISLAVSKDYNLIFIDIDHCVDNDGVLSEIANDIISKMGNQYIEFSQSGRGIHIITKGTIPKGFNNRQNGVEMYSDKRFCSLTGNALHKGEPSEEQDALNGLYELYKIPDKPQKIVRTQTEALNKSDNWVIEHASGHGRFDNLYSGNWNLEGYQSQSEADLSLCLILAFWTDCNTEQIDRIFRSSGLFREKWERSDYRNNTIQNAIDRCEETISEYISRKNREGGDKLDRALREEWDG